RPTKSAYPQTLPGHSLHIYRRRPVLSKSSILWLSLACRRAERVVPATWKDPQVRDRKINIPSCYLCEFCTVVHRCRKASEYLSDTPLFVLRQKKLILQMGIEDVISNVRDLKPSVSRIVPLNM